MGWDVSHKIKVMTTICCAVQYAHRNGIIHRDIKPANVVLDESSEPVLTDFDIADIRFATGLSTTVEGGLGTPVFAAPEQLEDADNADERSDVYSLGRLLYFLLLERSPGYEIERDPSLKKLTGHPTAVGEVVRRATQHAAVKRYRNVSEMISALDSVETRWAGIAAWVGRIGRWMRRNVALLTIVGLVAGGANAFAFLQQELIRVEAEQMQKYDDLSQGLKVALAAGDGLRQEIEAIEAAIAKRKEILPKLTGHQRITQQHEITNLDRRLSLLKSQKVENDRTLERLQAELDKLVADSSLPRHGAHTMSRDVTAYRRSLGCENSPSCQQDGLCTNVNGACMATTLGCIKSEGCRTAGRCVESDGRCIVAVDTCLASNECDLNGLCIQSGDNCIATEASCKKSRMCIDQGYCHEFQGSCMRIAPCNCEPHDLACSMKCKVRKTRMAPKSHAPPTD